MLERSLTAATLLLSCVALAQQASEPPPPPAPSPATAPTAVEEPDDADGTVLRQLKSIEVHGFVSPGFLYTTHQNNYLAVTNRGSFEFAEVGINFTKQLTEKLRTGLQLFTRDLGPMGNYSPKVDWFYLDYHFKDWLGIRAGRVKLPYGLYNDIIDVDSAHVAALLPQSIYPVASRDFLLAQTGIDLYGLVNLGPLGSLDYNVYGGTIYLDVPAATGSPIQIASLNVPFVVGARLLWETPLQGLRVGGSVQWLQLDATLLLGGVARVPIGVPANVWVASAEYVHNDFQASIEYSQWHSSTVSSNEMLYPSTTSNSERAYVMVSYRVNKWFHPGMYYSLYFPRPEITRDTRSAQQLDLATTLRFDINEHWLFKVEGHYMNGTAGMSTALNDGRPLNSLARHWALFVLKTTVSF